MNDITEFVEEETILMNDPLFAREALGEFNTKPERHLRQRNTNSYVVKPEDEADEQGVRTQDKKKKLEYCQLCNRHHGLDECKDFNNMLAAERSKLLAKQKLCYGCYESISAKRRA